MASEETKPVPRLLYTLEELLDLMRINLRYARSLPPGAQ
jgi:hypothetical protein